MSARRVSVLRAATPRDTLEALRRQYGERIELTGNADALYERHSQHWVRTEQTCDRTIADYTADIWHVNPCPVP